VYRVSSKFKSVYQYKKTLTTTALSHKLYILSKTGLSPRGDQWRPAPHLKYLGKVSPTFPTALFSRDARFVREIKKPQKGTKWADTT